MYISDGKQFVLNNVTFSGNTASDAGGGLYNFNGVPSLINVVFSGNQANYGGGIGFYGGSLICTNITVHHVYQIENKKENPGLIATVQGTSDSKPVIASSNIFIL
jgi:hypothetical protein